MKTLANIGICVSKSRPRLYVLFLALMVLPIALFTYSIIRELRDQTQKQAAIESTQIARVSAALVEEHFRQSTAFVEAFATRPAFRKVWTGRNQAEVT